VAGTTITNTLPDQTVTLTPGGATTITGTYPNFTISSTDNNTTYTAGTGINISGTSISSTQNLSQTLANGNSAGTYDVNMNSKSVLSAKVLGLAYDNANYVDLYYGHIRDYYGSHGTDGQLLRVRGTSPNTYVEWISPSATFSTGNGLSFTGNTLNSVWTQTGNNIYNNNAGRVGIGIAAPTGKLTVQGDTSNVLFEVKDKNGYSVFVVYQDSVQVFVNASGSKTNKGAFAVNPKAQSKSGSTNYLRVTPDSTRICTQDTLKGFGVRNIGTTGNIRTSYMQLTPSNYFIGHLAGKSITSGLYNCTYGYEAGINLNIGDKNVFVGYKSGHEQTSGWSNVAVGSESGRYANTTYTTFVGTNSGLHASGDDNVYLGYNAGNLTANNDNFNSVFIGSETGHNTFGGSNTIIGSGAGFCYYSTPYERDGNIFIGESAGLRTSAGGLDNDNICIGNNSGYASGLTGSNQLYIENSSDVTNPLIQGDFTNNRIAFHRKATTYPLQVGTANTNGNGAYLTAGGTWTNVSSRTLKDRFEELNKNDLLNKIKQMDVKAWYYKGTQERHIGPVAEDFYQAFGTGVLDEPVYLGKSLAAGDVAGVSFMAVKELIVKNEQQQTQINALTKKIEQLENKLNQISNSSSSNQSNTTR
jgi:hypothetical protein